MNKFIIPFILLFNIGNINNNPFKASKNFQAETLRSNKMINIKDSLYDLNIKIETNNDKHSLVFSIKLKNDSYFISPNEKRVFSGKFFYDLGTYDKVDFSGEVIETPISIKEVDSDNHGAISWVRKNTIYKQLLNLKSVDDFEVYGRVKFTIEPRCTLEVIPFNISYKSGKLIIKEAKC